MTPAKRVFDIVFALFLTVLLLPVIVLIALAILIIDGRPVFYLSERMKGPNQAFCLWKFRTMRSEAADRGVSAGYKSTRITPLGAKLRRMRMDELPQLLNVLRGDMSFVGPRPPLRHYVETCPQIYAKVLQHRPGVTGLATLKFHRTEEQILAKCACPEETEEVYVRRCIPRKAALDLIWAQNRSVCYDIKVLYDTARHILRGGKRRKG